MTTFSSLRPALLFTIATLLCGWAVPVGAEEEPAVITPAEARANIDKEATVEFEVKSTKDLLETRGAVYLDSESNFRDPKNFAVSIKKSAAAELKEKMIDDPAAYYKGKKIRVEGTIKDVGGVPRIEVTKASQITLVEPVTAE